MVLLTEKTKYKESELVNWWLWKFHPTSLQWRRVRLGLVPTHKMARMMSVILRWADAIFIEHGTVFIVEAKLRPTAGAIGQLEHYAKLFRRTPEFELYRKAPVRLILLTPVKDLELIDLCSEKRIIYEIYDPDKDGKPEPPV